MWSRGVWGRGSPMRGPGLSFRPLCTRHHHPWGRHPSSEPSQQSTVPSPSALPAAPEVSEPHSEDTIGVITPVSWSIIMAYSNHKRYCYLFLFLVFLHTIQQRGPWLFNAVPTDYIWPGEIRTFFYPRLLCFPRIAICWVIGDNKAFLLSKKQWLKSFDRQREMYCSSKPSLSKNVTHANMVIHDKKRNGKKP